MRAIAEGDLFLSARSSFFFLPPSFLTQNRALKLRFLQEKSDVLGKLTPAPQRNKKKHEKQKKIYEKNEKNEQIEQNGEKQILTKK